MERKKTPTASWEIQGRRRRDLRAHSGDKPYSYYACRKAFADPSALTVHLRVHSGDKPYLCNACGKAFARSNNLTRHLLVHP